MKKSYFLLIILLAINFNAFACEICGCGVGNFYLGLLPNFKSKFIGVRYSFLQYHTELAKDPTQFSNDYYKSTELWSGWNIGKKWQVLGFVPFTYNKKISDDGVKSNSGLGDISLMANYKLIQSRKINPQNQNIEHLLMIGGGIKLPTGAYHLDLTDPANNIGDANSMNGTGSTDLLMNVLYQLSIQQFGFNTTATYKANTVNAEDFRFGNRLTWNSLVFYRFNLNTITLSPNTGFMYERTKESEYLGSIIEQTGGYLLNASAGLEINFKKIAIGMNTQLPLKQSFGEGQTNSKLRGSMHISLSF